MNKLVELLIKSLLIGVLVIVVVCLVALVICGVYHYASLVVGKIAALFITALLVGCYFNTLFSKVTFRN